MTASLRPAPGLSFLGPPAVVDVSGVVHEIRGRRPATLLAVLASRLGRRVPVQVLHEEVWGARERTNGLLRVTLNRLRRQLDVADLGRLIVSERSGVVLDAPPDLFDTWALAHVVRQVARHGSVVPDDIVGLAEQADALWRGSPFEGVDDSPMVAAEVERLGQLRVELRRAHATALARRGDHREAVTLLSGIVEEDPYAEESVALLGAIEYALGRQRDAINVMSALHRRLARDVGLAASPNLRRVEQLILQGASADAVLTAALRSHQSAEIAGMRPRQPRWCLVGRRLLVDAIAAELASTRGVRLVGGPPGEGKTRLGSEIAELLVASGTPVIWSSCDRFGALLSPIPDLLRFATALIPGAGAREGSSAADVLAALQPNVASGPMDVELVRARLRDALERVLREARFGTVVVVDDLQWISSDAASVLLGMITGLPGLSWLLLCRSTDHGPACQVLLGELGRHGHDLTDLEPLSDDDVRRLCQSVDASMSPDTASVIAQRSAGNPFVAVELSRHASRGAGLGAIPRSLQEALGATLTSLSEPARRLAAILALEGALARDILSALIGAEDPVQPVDELVATGVARIDREGRPRLVHDVWADVVVDSLDRDRREELHHAIASAALNAGHDAGLVLRHLLDAGQRATVDELDRAATEGIASLMRVGALADAADLSRRYIERRGAGDGRRESLAGQIQAATALLMVGELDAGLALVDISAPRLDPLDDAALSADLILALGPVDVGSDASERLAPITKLIDVLEGDTRRIVQLHCWAAHLELNQDALAAASDHLDRAESVLAAALDADPFLGGLILGVRYQAGMLIEIDPADALAVYRRLDRYARLTGEISSEAMAAMFGVDHALRHDERSAAEAAVGRVERVAHRYTRPDVRWWAHAGRAAVALARGDVEEAKPDIDAAREIGAEAELPMGPRVAMLHMLVIALETGTLELLLPRATVPEASTQPSALAVLGGLGAARDGDLDVAGAIADGLARRERLISSEGLGWTAFAYAAGELVAASRSSRLARVLMEALSPYRGVGLSAGGLAYFGVADRILAVCARVLGDDTAGIHADAAVRLERERGWAPWVQRAEQVRADQ